MCEAQYGGTIVFAQVSFEDLIDAVTIPGLPKNLTDAVADFRAYLDEENLLPSWKRLLDVVNCAGMPDDILQARAYMCPAAGGPYNHRRCKYFGMYRDKRVEVVALIDAVVDLRDDDDAAVKWSNGAATQDELVERARQIHKQRRTGQFPTRVFLLGPLHETAFHKDTSGGMQSSKQYFDVESLHIRNVADLAAQLRTKTWTDMRTRTAG